MTRAPTPKILTLEVCTSMSLTSLRKITSLNADGQRFTVALRGTSRPADHYIAQIQAAAIDSVEPVDPEPTPPEAGSGPNVVTP